MKAKKKFGQNFLIDNNVLTKIVSSIPATKEDLIIEIGPGKGALTSLLKNKESKLIAYEVDTDLKDILLPLKDNKTNIIFQDFLEVDINNEIQNYSYQNLYIVGNLPYYITTPIIKHIIDNNLDISEMIFMVQNEVADRLCAKPKSKDYGYMTLFLQYYFKGIKLFTVPNTAFNPAPKVTSAVIKLIKREDQPVANQKVYFLLLKDAFSQKRKTLKNNLKNYNWEKILKVLNKYGYSEQVRAEELPEEVFIDIANL